MNDPFARYGAFIYRTRWMVLAIWLVILVVCGALFAPKAGSVLKAGGIEDPDSEAAEATRILEEEFNNSALNNAVIVYQSDELTVDDPVYRDAVVSNAEAIAEVEGVSSVVTFYTIGDPTLVSQDRRTTVVIISLEGDEGEAQEIVPDVRDAIVDVEGIEHYVTGTPAINHDFQVTSEEDLRRSEMVTIPLVLLLLVLTFRTIISAAVPLALGAAAVVTALSIIYFIGSRTDLSIFALNVASMIGLGLGIDFSLIVVNRFREEYALRKDAQLATALTMATAGRSITYSGITVILGMGVLTVMVNLVVVRSISLGVMLVALTALIGGVTLLPALLGILNHRLEWLRVLPKRKKQAENTGFWYRLSHAIMDRPWAWLFVSIAILAVIAWPARNLEMLGSTPGLLPSETESVQGVTILNEEFGENLLTPIQIVMQSDEPDGVFTPEFLTALDEFTNILNADPRSSQVQSLATFMAAEPREDGRWSRITRNDFTPFPPMDPNDPTALTQGIKINPFVDVWVDEVPHTPAYFGFGQFNFDAGESHQLQVTPALQVYRVNTGNLQVQAGGPVTFWPFSGFANPDSGQLITDGSVITLAAGDQLVVPDQTPITITAVDAVDMLTVIAFHVRPGVGAQDTWTEGNPTSDPFAGIERVVIGGGLGNTFPNGRTNIKLELALTDANSVFPRHLHPGPELIVVQEGVLTIHSSPEMVMTGADGTVREGEFDAPIELTVGGKAVVQGEGIHRAENLTDQPTNIWSLRFLDADEVPFTLIGTTELANQFVNLSGEANSAVLNVTSPYDPYDDRHEDFVREIRSLIAPSVAGMENYEVFVGGQSANFIDFSESLYGQFPLLVGAVLLLTYIILLMFFQSVFLPLKAILMNLASVLATYGALVMIFQYGWGDSLFGFESLGAIGVVTPAILFVILFSLSTDYEVFMLSRVKEYYHELGDNEEAVASGLQHTAGVITAAGVILIGVFGSFATAGIITIKEIGLGLAIGVLIDTTIVRIIMVPATMRLMGDTNWYMPAWLKKIVPELREGPAPEFAHAGVPGGVMSGNGAVTGHDGAQAMPAAAIGPRMAGQLRPTGGPMNTDLITLPRARTFRIGRDEKMDVQIFDVRISRYHAKIEHQRGEFIVSDLNSTNGVFVNGVRIAEPTVLRHGDILEIGNTGSVTFQFELRPLSEPPSVMAAGSPGATD